MYASCQFTDGPDIVIVSSSRLCSRRGLPTQRCVGQVIILVMQM